MNTKKAQSWTIDYLLGLMLFILGLGLSIIIINEVLEERTYDHLIQEATRLSQAAVTSGYPQNWEEHDVIRAGLTSNNRMSWRKAQILAGMQEQELREVLPILTNAAITIRNDTSIIALNNKCSIGTSLLPQTTNLNHTYYSLGYYSYGGSSLRPFLETRNASIYEPEELQILLQQKHRYDIIIFENAEFINQINDTYSQEQINNDLENMLVYAKEVFFIGNNSLPVLGLTLAEIEESTTIIQEHDSEYFLLEEGLNLTFTQARTTSVEEGHNYQVLADGLARWRVQDATIYYVSQTTGVYNNTLPFIDKLEQAIIRAQQKSSVVCEAIRPEDMNVQDLVYVERVIPDRGSLITIGVYVWRNP